MRKIPREPNEPIVYPFPKIALIVALAFIVVLQAWNAYVFALNRGSMQQVVQQDLPVESAWQSLIHYHLELSSLAHLRVLDDDERWKEQYEQHAELTLQAFQDSTDVLGSQAFASEIKEMQLRKVTR